LVYLLSWNSTNAVSATYSCTGPINASGPAALSGTQLNDMPYAGTESCTLNVVNGGGGTGSCSASRTFTAPTYSCTGTLPTNSTLYSDDNTGLTANTGYSYSASNTATKCQFFCNGGYTWNGSSCVATPPPTYTISYNGNGNTGGTVPASQTKTQGVSLTLRTNTGSLTKTGYTFSGWNTSSAGNGTTYPAGGTFTTNANTTLYAKWTIDGGGTGGGGGGFPPTPTYTFSVLKAGTGGGIVTSSPAGINCGSTCAQSFSSGTSVTLSQSASGGSTFAGWAGACSGTGTCTVSMNSSKTVSAIFCPSGQTWNATTSSCVATPPPTSTYTISYNGNGNTSGTIPASQTKTAGTSLTLRTNTGSLTKTGFTFDGWNTNSAGTGTSYSAGGTFTTDANTTLYAKWTAVTPPSIFSTLGVFKVGTGTGTVTSNPAGMNCTIFPCSQNFVSGGSGVVLTASPNASSSSLGWIGCDSSTATSCNVDMGVSRNVSVIFCPSGQTWNATTSQCVATAIPTYACTGFPLSAQAWGPTTTSVLTETAYQYSSTATTDPCRFHCAPGYEWNAASSTCNSIPLPPLPCTPLCNRGNSYCQGKNYSDSNACGTDNCPGTRYCDFNWKEASPER